MAESLTFAVSGMKCGGCEANVSNKLSAIDGVLMVKASSKDKEVMVEFDADKTGPSAIKTAIAEAGYRVD
jgi:copper chaperone